MEIVDIYDDNKKLTGKTIVRGTPVQPGEHCLVVHLCIINSRGEMLVQQRSFDKHKFPGVWDVSAGGFAESGENGYEAVLRETREELGLELGVGDIRYVLTEPFSYVFDEFYLYIADVYTDSLKLQKEEVADAKYMTEEQIVSKIKDGDFVDYPIDAIRTIFNESRL